MNFNIDTNQFEADAKKQLIAHMRSATEKSITASFSKRSFKEYNNKTGNYDTITTIGAGYQQIDDMLAAKLQSEEFKEQMNKFFEYKWKPIFEEAMIKALQHKANGIAFNKVHSMKW